MSEQAACACFTGKYPTQWVDVEEIQPATVVSSVTCRSSGGAQLGKMPEPPQKAYIDYLDDVLGQTD